MLIFRRIQPHELETNFILHRLGQIFENSIESIRTRHQYIWGIWPKDDLWYGVLCSATRSNSCAVPTWNKEIPCAWINMLRYKDQSHCLGRCASSCKIKAIKSQMASQGEPRTHDHGSGMHVQTQSAEHVGCLHLARAVDTPQSFTGLGGPDYWSMRKDLVPILHRGPIGFAACNSWQKHAFFVLAESHKMVC